MPLSFSISKRNLLEETKAISIPEKNAENAIDISSSIISPILNWYRVFYFWVVSAGAVSSTVNIPVLLNI